MIAGITACVLSACGGGGGGGNSTTTHAAQTPPKPVQIAAMGDSTMAALVKNADGTYTQTGDLVTDLQADLTAQLGGTITVVNRSIVGSTLGQAIAGDGAYSNTMAQYLGTDTLSKVVVENYGINDNATVPQDTFRQNLLTFISMVESAGKTPVLEEPNPLCDPNFPPSQNVEATDGHGHTIQAFVDIIDQVAQQTGVQVVHQYSLIKALPNWCAMMSDGWGHPNPALYAIKAQNDAAVLSPIIKGLQ